ncbi:MAG: 3'-5' exonuclease [Flavobacteriales bacterium]|nr:3'-5' exonuclease [Flavobacteriales bacterium]
MPLILKKPLIIFDLETTGVHISNDRIIDIFMLKAMPDGTEKTYYKRLNPGMAIPYESSLVHGIYDDDVVDCPMFKDIAHELNQFIADADFGGFNSNRFDFPMLVEEFLRVGIEFDVDNRKFVDAQRIFHLKEPRNLAAAYQFYCNQELADAHNAEADATATWEVIKAQIEKYEDLIPTVDYLHAFSGQNEFVDLAGRIKRDKHGQPIFAFGKHKNRTVAQVFRQEPSYFDWMMNGDFAENTKRVITKLMLQLKTKVS